MSIPDFQSLLLPVLQESASGEVKRGEVIERLASKLCLSADDRSAPLSSGRSTIFGNRIDWARVNLGKAGLVQSTGPGQFQITPAGREVLRNPPERIDLRFLGQFPEFRNYRQAAREKQPIAEKSSELNPATALLTPDEAMRSAQQQLEASLAGDLLVRLIAAPPDFFERVVLKLLSAMGYGGSVSDAARPLGRSGDGGVDGVIDQDALGLDRVYVQAKRYGSANTVGASAIRDFFGALDSFKAAKGLFITTSSFTESARETARTMSKRIVLIDGDELTKKMIRYGVGCRIEETLYVKKIDEEFFDE